jgi:sugar phosphate isomerase/epimerase
MKLSISSYSFHRLLQAGKQDIFRYITDCYEFGCSQLDPWNAHLAVVEGADAVQHAGAMPWEAQLPPKDDVYLSHVKSAADAADLPFGCIAVDGAHIYDADPAVCQANRTLAYRWLEIAAQLGARQIRFDAGGPEEMSDEVFPVIVAGYRDLVARGRAKGIDILIENHWGPGKIPENLVRILDEVEGLGLLFDTHNWAPGLQQLGWMMCAKYASACHIKTFAFDVQGNERTADIPLAIRYLVDAGYQGAWGVESVPREINEYEGVRRTIALIRRTLDGLGIA